MEPTWPTSDEVADTIKKAIRAADLSQHDVAERSGVALTTLNRRLNGSPFTYSELVAVARVIGRSASSLLAEAEQRSQTAAA